MTIIYNYICSFMVRSAGSIYTRKRKYRQCFRKGFRNCSPGRYRLIIQKVKKAKTRQTLDRKYRKRGIKSLWIKRIYGALKVQANIREFSHNKNSVVPAGSAVIKTIGYSQWIYSVHLRGSKLNKKMLAQIAVGSPELFYRLGLWLQN